MHPSLPNILTVVRLFFIPFVLLGIYINTDWARGMATWVYFFACITDYFDGYLARRMGVSSPLGRFLDPIADKLLVATIIIGLLAIDIRYEGLGMWNGLAGLIIVLREMLVSGLREYLAEIQVSVPVSRLAKWKTATQMLALGFLVAGDRGAYYIGIPIPSYDIGIVLIWVSAILTVVTGYDYMRAGLHHMRIDKR